MDFCVEGYQCVTYYYHDKSRKNVVQTTEICAHTSSYTT